MYDSVGADVPTLISNTVECVLENTNIDAVLSHHYGNLQGANLNSAFFIGTAGLV